MAIPLIAALVAPTLTTEIIGALSVGAGVLTKYASDYFMDDDDFDYNERNLQTSSFTSLQSNSNQDFQEQTQKVNTLKTLVKDHIKTKTNEIDQIFESGNLITPTYEKTHIIEKQAVVTTADNLIDVLKESSNESMEWRSEQSMFANAMLEAIYKIVEQQSAQTQALMTIANLKAKEGVTNEVSAQSLANTLPVIAQNLSLLPKITKALEASVQTSITSLKLQDEVVTVEYSKANSLAKNGNLADYELNGEVTNTKGETLSPALAKAQHSAEKALETSSSNKIDADDYFDLLDDVDFNIFAYVLNTMKGDTNE